MSQIYLLDNPIKNYDWGSRSAIASLKGEMFPTMEPQAEMWMGAHPSAPSKIISGQRDRTMSDVIAEAPAEILGPDVAEKFDNRLPFLFKILAADKPLSIQAHPDKTQAEAGFDRENSEQISLGDNKRSYKDRNHKPEIICALTEFWALNGFRSSEQIIELFDMIGLSKFSRELKASSSDLKNFFNALMALPLHKTRCLLRRTLKNLEKSDIDPDIRMWIRSLYDVRNEAGVRVNTADIGVLSPLFLNLIKLRAGEAMYLEAGRLHAYLHGVGVELMANSDNVLRGGLTSKHKDVAELLKILKFVTHDVNVLHPARSEGGEEIYSTDASEFRLSRINVYADEVWRSSDRRNIEILICLSGFGRIHAEPDGEPIQLKRGASLMIPASVSRYQLTGPLEVYKATVP
ncbi:MAG: mannose-6-phosphate isomerase, class I [candidate division KSB1 bacterium]|jgi:mannose-6-phosphate isomerase|nr:mannose-6-phosphate isomerase, class I [candidate division KSB1 bacterium]